MVTRRTVKAPRPAGSLELAINRARAAWDNLTGGPDVRTADGSGRVFYSDTAAAAILRSALWMWSDSALAVDA
jgi:hypothetical protein